VAVADSIILKPSGPVRATVRPPGSKSITNRALVCAALARGESLLTGALESEDTQVMLEALGRLGIDVQRDPAAATVRVSGCDGQLPASGADLFVGNSGTTMRFLTALVALGRGTFRLDGVPRMRARPIGDLLEALVALGVSARSELGNGCPPVVVEAAGLRGGRAEIRGDVSSQFLSGLLLAAPYADARLEIEVAGDLVSRPYVEMTLAVMRSFGAEVVASGEGLCYRVSNGARYQGRTYAIEPDASAASYFFGAAAATGGDVTVQGLGRGSLQGDVAFCDCLERMGCEVQWRPHSIRVVGRPLAGIEADMNAISDTAQTLAVVALFAEGPTTIRGVAHIRHKETDRIADLARELRKLGAAVDELPDGLRIAPGELRGAAIDTYGDHRMAMSFALAGLRIPSVEIRDPGCVAKTYPRYFDDLRQALGG
jgi:3-phosphoshikimate 1-carboxyvinyltransferase